MGLPKLAIAISSPTFNIPSYNIASIWLIVFSFFTSNTTPFALFPNVILSFKNFCERPHKTINNSGIPSFVFAEHGTKTKFFVKSVIL